jgi:hypothetical protein
MTAGTGIWHADELRLGLRGQTRRVLAPRGIKVVQRLQVRYEWRYLLLAVEPLLGDLRWEWLARMRAAHLAPVVEDWALDGLVWDGAPAHKAKTVRALSTKQITLPAYSPELNPAERVFEEIRRHVEGRVYLSLAAKQAAVETYLTELAASPAQVQRLCGRAWLTAAVAPLPRVAQPD